MSKTEQDMDLDCMSPKFRAQMFQGEFGLEKETIRVTKEGTMALTPHPFSKEEFGRDFAECQLEMVTPVCHSTRELHETLTRMQQEAKELLQAQESVEYLWPCSNPPMVIGEIPVAKFDGELQWKSDYREHLAKVYGKHKMLFSGIHYNFSFPRELIGEACCERVYLNLAKQLYEFAYIPVLLMAASPIYDASLLGGNPGNTIVSEYASIRCGRRGYWNPKKLFLDFSSVEAYVRSVHEHIRRGEIQLASELYLPVRLKSKGDHTLDGLLDTGVAYVEYRLVDLNPLEATGIDYRDLEFLHLFMIYLTFLPSMDMTEEKQSEAIDRIWQAAELEPPKPLVEEALDILEDMRAFFAEEDIVVAPFIEYQEEKLRDPKKRYANQMIERYGSDYIGQMLEELR